MNASENFSAERRSGPVRPESRQPDSPERVEPTPEADGTTAGSHRGLTPCSAWPSFWFVGSAHFGQLDAVAKEYRRTYDALPELSRPKALVVWGDNSIVIADALMHYGLPTIRLIRMVGGRHYDSGEIPNVVREFHRFVEDFDDFISTTAEPCWRDAPRPDEMTDSDKGKRVAGTNLVEVKVVAFVPPCETGDVGLTHESNWVSSIPNERRSAGTAGKRPDQSDG